MKPWMGTLIVVVVAAGIFSPLILHPRGTPFGAGFLGPGQLATCLTSPLPSNFSAWLATLATMQGRHAWRVYATYHREVYPYTAFLNGFDILNYSNHGIKPKYQYHTEHNLKMTDLERTWRLLEILNVRYLLLSQASTFLHAQRTQPIRITPEAALYEVTSARPRA